MQPESQLQSIQCGGISFLLDISWLPFVLCFHDAYPYQQNLRNVALDGRPHFWTSALLSRGGIPPRITFLDFYDQTPPLHSLTQTPMTTFVHPRTTGCPQIGPLTQHIYRYILLSLSYLQQPLKILLSCFSGRKEDFYITTITLLLSYIIFVCASTFLTA